MICESTGVYHRSLLHLAVRRGMRTALAGGEAVAKLRVVESNDPGKTDLKDPRAILTVALVGRLLIHRQLDGTYECLREWHQLYCRADQKMSTAKTELHHALKLLFPDLKLAKDVLYGPTGRALVEQYAADPQRIVRAGRKRFEAKLRKHAKGVKRKTLDAIYAAAEQSASQQRSAEVARIQSQRVRDLYEETLFYKARKEAAGEEMKKLYRRLRELDRALPAARKGVISELGAARLLAETGPLSDFRNQRQLMRYAGLNLSERQSGRWKGQTKICRRGRARLRKVLNILALSLVQRQRLFGNYYHGKKDRDRMPGDKAMTCVMRKLLKMFFGWYRSAQEFDESRVFVCASQYGRSAA